MRYLFIFFALFSTGLYGQTRDVISASGTSGTALSPNNPQTSAYKVSYTIGEVVVPTGTTSSGVVTQGFHQTYNVTISALDEITENFEMKVYPNPTQDRVFIKSESLNKMSSVRLYNEMGALVMEIPVEDQDILEFSVTDLSNGRYILRTALKNNPSQQLNYQLIKAD